MHMHACMSLRLSAFQNVCNYNMYMCNCLGSKYVGKIACVLVLLEETFHQLIDPDSIYSCGMWILGNTLNTAGNLIIQHASQREISG